VLADYYARSALAAAQVLEGFDAERFRARLEETPVGLSAGADGPEAEAICDLAVRLLARLYPRLALVGAAAERLAPLARAVNPAIDLARDADAGIVVGAGEPFARSVYAGSDGWDALIGAAVPQPVGDSANPIGPGAAAAIAAAGLFRIVFLDDWRERADDGLRFAAGGAEAPLIFPAALPDETVLVGAGAIGNAALWALTRSGVTGRLHVVDMETVELSNLQRYVLCERADEGALKVEVARRHAGALELAGYPADLAAFLNKSGYAWPAMLLALDNARDRVAAQASLPRWIANAWTQPGDLGLSVHPSFGGDGACVSCLYLPDVPARNEDELLAEALHVPHMLMQVRTLLYTGDPLDIAFLQAVASAIGQPVEALAPFEGRTIRDLYVEGFCGGAVIPLGEAGRPHTEARDVHVPLAHQSALAGVLLAGATLARPARAATATRIDLLRPLGISTTQPVLAHREGRCICDDPDYVRAWRAKWERAR
jgi:hypothetical protein